MGNPKPSATFRIRSGWRLPPGATATAEGVNFSVFSRHASAVSLVLYRNEATTRPLQVIPLDPAIHRTHFFWHVFVEGARPGLYYAWRAQGPGNTEQTGFRFDPRRLLLDPWARAVSDVLWERESAISKPGGPSALRARITGEDAYNWEGDQPVDHPFQDSIIYEMHVGGFTRHPSSGVQHPGTFAALIEKIDHLKDLGVTDVELLPVMAFDSQDVPASTAALGLSNYWGYSTYGFFAPHPGYAWGPDARTEFRDMVKALHRAGIGVILDVVFNHTSEGGEGGPTIHFKGLANETYYHLDSQDRRRYRDYTGCGNTVNCNHPVVTDLLVRCLEYWVAEMHVDGFRFDLASVLARDEDGHPMHHPPVLWAIEFSPILAHTKLIVEAWDAAGLYQVGEFPGLRWMEWNARYRDTVRRAVRGEVGLRRELATRIAGSSDLHEDKGKLPINSLNYVTCHDGFTLWDLVSYDSKHNEGNGEDNRDGTNENLSWNCGAEGPTDDPKILALRRRQARNHMAILFLSQGMPMLYSGDEVLRTQDGNNNGYCQDNAIGWFNWSMTERHADMLRFTREMIALRRRHRSLRRDRFLTGALDPGPHGRPDIVWHGDQLGQPEWDDPESETLAFTLAAIYADGWDLHVMINMSPRGHLMAIPDAGGSVNERWFRAVDTALESPEEIVPPHQQHAVVLNNYHVASHSVVVLECRKS